MRAEPRVRPVDPDDVTRPGWLVAYYVPNSTVARNGRQLLAELFHQGPGGFHSGIEQSAQLGPLLAQLQLAARLMREASSSRMICFTCRAIVSRNSSAWAGS
jgi:hypothetical protein